MSLVARRHDLNANLLFTWRRRYGACGKDGEGSTRFVPAVITNDTSAQAPAAIKTATGSTMGRMEIELPGGYRLIAGRDVDTAVLGRVIKVLLDR